MSVRLFHSLPRPLRPLLLLAPALVGLALLPGCENDTYSEAVHFTVRTDPIVLEAFPGERIEPDRPGQLPLLSYGQLDKIASLLPDNNTQAAANKLRDPNKLGDNERQTLEDLYQKYFGTPGEPHLAVKGVEGIVKDLKLNDTILAHGANVYRVQCVQCHGVEGDGRGSTAPWVNPHPRDYRPGLFKFQSVDQAKNNRPNQKPLRADLYRTLVNGIEGTAMPAFNLLPEADLEALVSYVIFLSVRGEAELITFEEALEEDSSTHNLVVKKGTRGGLERAFRSAAADVLKSWQEAQGNPIEAGPYPKYTPEQKKESVQRGYALFVTDIPRLKELFPKLNEQQLTTLKGISCALCHQDFGRQARFKFDVWGTMVRPANLTTGTYRGGRRPIDIYWRIHSGINGSPMNIFGSEGLLSSDQIWDLVNFVQALPYPAMMKREYDIDIK
jgi:mono/diheme cytochrome c family protein